MPVSYKHYSYLRHPQAVDYFVVLICMVLIPSAVLHGLMGVDEKTVFAISAPIVLAATWMMSGLQIHKTVPFLILSFATIGVVATLVAGSDSQFLMGVTLSVAVIVGYQLYKSLTIPKLLRFLTWFTLALLVAGLIGIVYSAAGGTPLFEIQVGYRTTRLYLTTFSFASISNFIRPSGIFDEPGAFAMYAAIVTMFNDTLRQNHMLNLMIVMLIVFTGSLAGLALVILYLLTSNLMNIRRKFRLKFIVGLLIALLITLVLFPENQFTRAVDVFYSDRLTLVDGGLAGDNRSNQISDFFGIVNDEMLLRGAKNLTQDYTHIDQSSNPFSITFGYGLIISLPYFALLSWLVLTTIKHGFRNSYTSLGLLILLLQRPYIYHMSWSILIAAVIWLLYVEGRDRRFWNNV